MAQLNITLNQEEILADELLRVRAMISNKNQDISYLLANNMNIFLTEKSFVGNWSVNFSDDGSGRFIFVLGIPAKLSPESIAELIECGIEAYIETRDILNDFAGKIEQNEEIAIETLVPGAASGNDGVLVSFHPILEALLDDNFEDKG